MYAPISPDTPSSASTRPRLLLSDVVLIGLGLSTAVLTALALAVTAAISGFALHAASIWGVIPAGAFLCGTAAASGYALGAKVIGRRPGRLARIAVLVGGPVTYGLIFLFQYLIVGINGVPAYKVVSFGDFVDAMIRATSFSYKMRASTGPIGIAGYAFAFLNFVGFTVGSSAILGASWLSGVACDRCARYMTMFESASGYGTPEVLPVQFKFARKLLLDGETRAAMDVVAGLPQADSSLQMTLDVATCEVCSRDYHHLQILQWQTHARPPWVPVKAFNQKGQVSVLEVSARGELAARRS